MAPNPIMVPRSQEHQQRSSPGRSSLDPTAVSPLAPTASLGLTPALVATAASVALAATLSWARRWLLSGCAIETLAILYGAGYGTHIFSSIPLWTLLATLNLVYAICSTSWLLFGFFAAGCYPCILLTCLFQFNFAADFARRNLRKVLRQLHFTRDKIALFNLPALEIDTTVDGLFVIRGITIELSSLTIVAHAIELGLKLADDIELALHADTVTIRLFRSITINEVFASVKGGEEMTFGDLDDARDDTSDDGSIFINDTPLLRAATLGSEGFKDRPKLRESLTGVSYIKDSSFKDSFDAITALSPDDDKAERQYHAVLTDLRTSSVVYQSRAAVKEGSKGDNGFNIDDDKSLRAAICAAMHELPSVPHAPSRSVKVTTLQRLSAPAVRRFMHRLPFLLRLLLMPISYFHPISIAAISAAGSGKWLKALLKAEVFKDYTANTAELRRIERRLSAWLADANFCVQLTDIVGQGQVPLSTIYDINTYLKFEDIMAYRTEPESGVITQVIRLGGADATFTIPSYLLPHHEHIIPPKPTEEDEESISVEIEAADGKPKAIQAEQKLEHLKKDEATIKMSVHGTLPAVFDQSLLNFVAALVKATKVIELEKEVDDVDSPRELALSPTLSNDSTDTSRTVNGGFKKFTANIRQGLKDVSTADGIREMARDLHQSTRDGVKKVVVGGMINDRWIAKMVGKIASKLEQAQGDIGYSGDIPVPLAPYRAAPGLPSKLLP